VRAEAERRGLRTAAKPDSQDVCFIPAAEGRGPFLRERIPLRPAVVVDGEGREVGRAPAVELVTIGQRRGLGLGGGGAPRYVVDVDPGGPDRDPQVRVGTRSDLFTDHVRLADLAWSAAPVSGPLTAQCSAHGPAHAGRVHGDLLRWAEPQRRVAPGQSVVLYDGDLVVGGGTAVA
ncbi:MAG TPA: tRNA 2-thiouridine(34) synthase MnmA, partial [Acidimicrobiales bacterium]|nr:tRNA 2-thiouridine(34) synthase MnmA [Acidimicrobiales bacterium]